MFPRCLPPTDSMFLEFFPNLSIEKPGTFLINMKKKNKIKTSVSHKFKAPGALHIWGCARMEVANWTLYLLIPLLQQITHSS
jgi:hypothetical protein